MIKYNNLVKLFRNFSQYIPVNNTVKDPNLMELTSQKENRANSKQTAIPELNRELIKNKLLW